MNGPVSLHRNLLLPIGVWLARIVVGGVFVLSGFVKSIDLWGFVYKIEEYLLIWDFSCPRSLVFAAALIVSGFEFVTGLLLMVGSYRRSVPLLLLLQMLFMLPLTAYIWLTDPVADCGCFGDFLVISNGMTFLKNLVLTALIIFLLLKNRKTSGLYGSYIQWFVLILSVFYILFIGIFGYNVQPLLDFRSFPEGTPLLQEKEDNEGNIEFIYEKDGKRQIFNADNLPDSTWTYVERKTKPTEGNSVTEFFILEDGDNITQEVIDTNANQLLLIIPEYIRADASYTYLINEIDNYAREHGVGLEALIGGDSEDVEDWIDLSMADYPVYSAEPTLLKELSRGVMSIVYLEKGTVIWKRTASSIDADRFEHPDNDDMFASLYFDGRSWLRNLTVVFFCILAVIFLLDRSGRLLKWKSGIKKPRFD